MLRWARISELVTADADPLRNTVRERHELLVDFVVVGVHQADLVSGRVDGGEREHKVSNAIEVQLVGKDLVTGTASRVPGDC